MKNFTALALLLSVLAYSGCCALPSFETASNSSADIEPIAGQLKVDSNFLRVKLEQPPNYLFFILPALTLVAIIAGTILSVRTINARAEEARLSIENSIQAQADIATANIESEERRLIQQTLSSSRQSWINSLRDEISLALARLTDLQLEYDLGGDNHRAIVQQCWVHIYKISLLTNAKEQEHRDLSILLRDTLAGITKKKHMGQSISEITTLSQSILKSEWERVKNPSL